MYKESKEQGAGTVQEVQAGPYYFRLWDEYGEWCLEVYKHGKQRPELGEVFGSLEGAIGYMKWLGE